MKIFLSHRFTGENLDELKKTLSQITKYLESKNISVFCSAFKEDYFQKQDFCTKEIYDYCNQRLIEHDTVLFFIKSDESSHGMQLELDVANKHNKKMFLLIQKDLKFQNFRELADNVIEFQTIGNIDLSLIIKDQNLL